MVLVRVEPLVQVEEVLAHVGEVPEELEHNSRGHVFLIFDEPLASEGFSKVEDGFGIRG